MGQLADRVSYLSESQTIKMAGMSRELAAKGFDVINLSLGEPDFVTPRHIRDAAKQAIDEGFTFYTPISGYTDLRKAVAEKFKRENHLDFAPEQIVISTGAKQSITNVILSLVNPGDEVIIPAPYWVSYVEIIKLAGGKSVLIPTAIENDFKITPAQLEEAITPQTKLFIFSSPGNPTGSVYSKSELKALADVFLKHEQVYILSDEIYEHINFVGTHESIAQFEPLRNRIVVVNGVSKGYAMTGWRIGYIGAPKEIAQACDKMQGQVTSGTSSISQKAALAALTSGSDSINLMKDAFLKRRNLIINLLKDVPGIKINMPQGAFYVFPNIASFFGKSDGETIIRNAQDLCMYLLTKAYVSVVPGDAFGAPDYMRISYAASEEKITEAIKRIRNALVKLH